MDIDNRIAVVSILVENPGAVEQINKLLHGFSPHIIGRIGIPCRHREVSVICVVLDAPPDITSSLSGKIGMLDGVSSKTVTTKQ